MDKECKLVRVKADLNIPVILSKIINENHNEFYFISEWIEAFIELRESNPKYNYIKVALTMNSDQAGFLFRAYKRETETERDLRLTQEQADFELKELIKQRNKEQAEFEERELLTRLLSKYQKEDKICQS